jgi:hypothetical protein
MMRIFIAGIMQGSHTEAVLHEQDYRLRIKELIARHLPGADVYDPLSDHAKSLEYGDRKGRDVFFHHNRMCREVDVLLAFVPSASMGTAIEMWEAFQHGAAVVTISPLKLNWAVKFLSHVLYSDMEEFSIAIEDGSLRQKIENILADRKMG